MRSACRPSEEVLAREVIQRRAKKRRRPAIRRGGQNGWEDWRCRRGSWVHATLRVGEHAEREMIALVDGGVLRCRLWNILSLDSGTLRVFWGRRGFPDICKWPKLRV